MKTRILSVLALAIIFAISFSSCKDDENNNNNGTYEEVEPNDSFGTANDLTISETYDGEINPISEIDYFKVTASGDVTVTVDGGDGLEVRVHFFDHAEVDFWGDDAGARGAALTHSVSGSEYNGYFYVQVQSAYGNDTGTYTIKYE